MFNLPKSESAWAPFTACISMRPLGPPTPAIGRIPTNICKICTKVPRIKCTDNRRRNLHRPEHIDPNRFGPMFTENNVHQATDFTICRYIYHLCCIPWREGALWCAHRLSMTVLSTVMRGKPNVIYRAIKTYWQLLPGNQPRRLKTRISELRTQFAVRY